MVPIHVTAPSYARAVTLFGDFVRRDRERSGLSTAQAAWRFCVSTRVYREIEAGTRWPDFDTYLRMSTLYG
jgi:ribosome-binding protein aMBF1 (putative translation factor)